MTEPTHAPSARLLSELVAGRRSWPVVVLVYAAGGAILAVLLKFLESYQRFARTLDQSVDVTLQPGPPTAITLWASILAVMVFLCVFGGGFLFVSRSRHLERMLAQRAAELEEVDRSRRLFFAKASHELRTPVTTLRGEAEVALADEDDPEALRRALTHIVAHAQFLGHRIEELIGIAQTSDGKLHLDMKRVDLRDIVASAAADAQFFASSVEVAIKESLPAAPAMVSGDQLWLKRALLAVIENALKFSPMQGNVEVTLIARDGGFEMTVADQGPGVVADELPLIFDAYYQAEAGKTRGGSG